MKLILLFLRELEKPSTQLCTLRARRPKLEVRLWTDDIHSTVGKVLGGSTDCLGKPLESLGKSHDRTDRCSVTNNAGSMTEKHSHSIASFLSVTETTQRNDLTRIISNSVAVIYERTFLHISQIVYNCCRSYRTLCILFMRFVLSSYISSRFVPYLSSQTVFTYFTIMTSCRANCVLVNLESLVECSHEFVIYSCVFIDLVQYQVSWQASQCFNCQHQYKFVRSKFC